VRDLDLDEYSDSGRRRAISPGSSGSRSSSSSRYSNDRIEIEDDSDEDVDPRRTVRPSRSDAEEEEDEDEEEDMYAGRVLPIRQTIEEDEEEEDDMYASEDEDHSKLPFVAFTSPESLMSSYPKMITMWPQRGQLHASSWVRQETLFQGLYPDHTHSCYSEVDIVIDIDIDIGHRRLVQVTASRIAAPDPPSHDASALDRLVQLAVLPIYRARTSQPPPFLLRNIRQAFAEVVTLNPRWKPFLSIEYRSYTGERIGTDLIDLKQHGWRCPLCQIYGKMGLGSKDALAKHLEHDHVEVRTTWRQSQDLGARVGLPCHDAFSSSSFFISSSQALHIL
jgi:hypothetical protein